MWAMDENRGTPMISQGRTPALRWQCPDAPLLRQELSFEFAKVVCFWQIGGLLCERISFCFCLRWLSAQGATTKKKEKKTPPAQALRPQTPKQAPLLPSCLQTSSPSRIFLA